MTDCIFCKIVTGNISSTKIYEDDKFLAFLDLSPVNEGHALLIPKEHSPNFAELNPELGTQLVAISQQLGKAMKEGLGADGINIVNNWGKAAGQQVFHTHIHLIPRFIGDGFKHWPGSKTTPDELVIAAQKIISKLH